MMLGRLLSFWGGLCLVCNKISTLGVAFEEDALMALQRDLDSLILPAVPKAQLRDRLGQLRKQCLG